MLDFFKSLNPVVLLTAGCALFLAGLALMLLIIFRGRRQRQKQEKRKTGKNGKKRKKQAASALPGGAAGGSVAAYLSSVIGSRAYQQDCAATFEGNIPEDEIAKKGFLAVVCDGMGGMQGGERASRLCAEFLMQSYYGPEEFASPAAFYAAQIPKADAAVSALRNDDGEPLGGGTTLVAAIVKDNRAYCASVGDSRIYLFREGELIQLTRDHNYLLRLTEMVQNRKISMEAALQDPQREALISYIGMGTGPDIVDIDAKGFPLERGDLLLLCSDGLYKAMSQEEICRVTADNLANLHALPAVLTSAAFSKGWIAHDNITVVVVNCAPAGRAVHA